MCCCGVFFCSVCAFFFCRAIIILISCSSSFLELEILSISAGRHRLSSEGKMTKWRRQLDTVLGAVVQIAHWRFRMSALGLYRDHSAVSAVVDARSSACKNTRSSDVFLLEVVIFGMVIGMPMTNLLYFFL